MGSKFGPNQLDVLNKWASNSRVTMKAGRLSTDNGRLYSYDLLIGNITPGNMLEDGTFEHLRVVFDYQSRGINGVSTTTAHHVAKAKRFAHLVYPVNLSGEVDWKNPRLGPVLTRRLVEP